MPSKAKCPQHPTQDHTAAQPSPTPVEWETIYEYISKAQYLLMKTEALAGLVRTVGEYQEDVEVRVSMDVIKDFLTEAQHHLQWVEGVCHEVRNSREGGTPPTSEEGRS